MYVQEETAYIEFSTICGFRHPLAVLEHTPAGKGVGGGYCISK